MMTWFDYAFIILNGALIANGLCQLVRIFRYRVIRSEEWWTAYNRMHGWKEEGLLPKHCSLIHELERVTNSFWTKTTLHRLRLLSGPNGWFYYQVLSARKQWGSWNPK